jgi:hypothetical protein
MLQFVSLKMQCEYSIVTDFAYLLSKMISISIISYCTLSVLRVVFMNMLRFPLHMFIMLVLKHEI